MVKKQIWAKYEIFYFGLEKNLVHRLKGFLSSIGRKIIFIPVTPVQHGTEREREREREREHLLHACVTNILTKMQNKLGYDIRWWDLHTWLQLPISPMPHAKLFKDNLSKLKLKTVFMERGLFFSFLFSVLTSWWVGTFSFFCYYYFFMLLLNLLQNCCFLFTSTTFFFFFWC